MKSNDERVAKIAEWAKGATSHDQLAELYAVSAVQIHELQTLLRSLLSSVAWLAEKENIQHRAVHRKVIEAKAIKEIGRSRAALESLASRGVYAGLKIAADRSTKRNKAAADALHSKPGGSRDKAEQIREIWKSGKYSNRDLCAEEECAALKMSFSAARKALRNVTKST
jgi:hypothetical protein